jgi:hypothetical protein
MPIVKRVLAKTDEMPISLTLEVVLYTSFTSNYGLPSTLKCLDGQIVFVMAVNELNACKIIAKYYWVHNVS